MDFVSTGKNTLLLYVTVCEKVVPRLEISWQSTPPKWRAGWAPTHYELFVSLRSHNFGCKINRIIPLLVLISSKLPAITNIIHKLLWALQTIPNNDQKGPKPHPNDFASCNMQIKQHHCTILATATGNCDVTNVTYNENKYYVVTWTVYLESSTYLNRRQWLRQIAVVCHIYLLVP